MNLRRLFAFLFCVCLVVNVYLIAYFTLSDHSDDEIFFAIPVSFNQTTIAACERVLYYRNFAGGGGGLQHVTALLQWEIADALHYNFTHLIVENARLNKGHGRTNFVNATTKINESWWYYYDIDAIGKRHNLEILHYQSNKALQLFEKYENETSFVEYRKVCNESLISDKCGMMTVRTGVHGYPKWWCKSFKKPSFDPSLIADFSPNVFDCISQSQMRTNNSLGCVLHARVRRGDMLSSYKLLQHQQFVSAQGIAAVSAHLAHQFCAIGSKVKLYLATNGKDEYLQDVRSNLSNFDTLHSIQLVTKHDLVKRLNGTLCAQEIRQNNHFLFALEKAMIYSDNLIDAHFVARPIIFKRGKYTVHNEWYTVFANNTNQSVYFKDLHIWLVKNKMINDDNQSLFKHVII